MPAGGVQVEVARIARVLEDAPSAPADWLSESEFARLATIRHAGRREQFLAGRWLVRRVLARCFAAAPLRDALVERRSQSPAVYGHEHSRFVSISHGAQWVAAAAADVAVGIDLEQRPRVFDAAIAPLLLEPNEPRTNIDADTLLQRWGAKEAWLKRFGGGALPARLAASHLRPVPAPHADVCLHGCAAFHLGVAVERGVFVKVTSEVPIARGAAFAVSDPGIGVAY
jgi:4'-phosphopantetheinyl transferase